MKVLIDRSALEEILYALEYASDMTKPEGLSGCDCPICTAIPTVKDMLKKQPELDTSVERVQVISKRQHVTDGTRCWCEPVLTYVDPVSGAEVWTHREEQ